MSVRFSQIAVETLQRPTTAKVRASQIAVEAVQRPTTARVSQLAVEVISHNGGLAGSGSGSGNRMLIIAT